MKCVQGRCFLGGRRVRLLGGQRRRRDPPCDRETPAGFVLGGWPTIRRQLSWAQFQNGSGVAGLFIFHIVADDSDVGEVHFKQRCEGGILDCVTGNVLCVGLGVIVSGCGEAGKSADGSVRGKVEFFEGLNAGLVERFCDTLLSVVGVNGDVNAVEDFAVGVVVGEVESAGEFLPWEVRVPNDFSDTHVGAAGDDLVLFEGNELSLGKSSDVGGDVFGLPEEFFGERWREAGTLESDDSGDVIDGCRDDLKNVLILWGHEVRRACILFGICGTDWAWSAYWW